MNVMSAIAEAGASMRAVTDEAASLANVHSGSWKPSHTERLLRLGVDSEQAATGVYQLSSVKFTGPHSTMVRSVIGDLGALSRGVRESVQHNAREVASKGVRLDTPVELRKLADMAAPTANSLQAIRNLVYRP